MFSPCAPIGGTTCAASATSAVRGPSSRSATCATIGQSRRALASRSAPEHAAAARVQRRLELRGVGIAASAAARGPASIQTTAEAVRAVAVGQRHQRERPARAVDLGRDALVRQRRGSTVKTSAFWP